MPLTVWWAISVLKLMIENHRFVSLEWTKQYITLYSLSWLVLLFELEGQAVKRLKTLRRSFLELYRHLHHGLGKGKRLLASSSPWSWNCKGSDRSCCYWWCSLGWCCCCYSCHSHTTTTTQKGSGSSACYSNSICCNGSSCGCWEGQG